tara:strand:+ start:60 stop:668 length:609 start_codon:yes stop_codon:yes gene_type:complete
MSAAPRRFLVVFAHPLRDSLSAALRDSVLDGLRAAGHQTDLVDLYEDGFDPRLSAEERTAFMKPGYSPPADVAGYCERLRATDGVVLVFPQWWFNMPAILKGFIDRVFVPGVAFDPDPAGGRLIPRLENLRSVHVVSTTGAPWWITELYMRNPVRRQIRNGIARVCGRGVTFRMLSMYRLDGASPHRCQRFIEKVRMAFSRV